MSALRDIRWVYRDRRNERAGMVCAYVWTAGHPGLLIQPAAAYRGAAIVAAIRTLFTDSAAR